MKVTRRSLMRGLALSATGVGVISAGGAAYALRHTPEDVIYDLTVEIFGEASSDVPALRAFARHFSDTYGGQLSPTERRVMFAALGLFRDDPKMLNRMRLHSLAARAWRLPDIVAQAFHERTTFFSRSEGDALEFTEPTDQGIYFCENPFAEFDEDD